MIESLHILDTKLFIWLNGMHSEFWDPVMWWISGKLSWIPLYLVILGLIIYKNRWRALWILLFVAITITISDQASVHLFKNVFERLRPCHVPELAMRVHLVNDYCGGRYGFVSSHAANSFAVAVFTALILRNSYYWGGILFWATVVGYSRIYLGVHFPGDIIGGALLGSLLACLVYNAYVFIFHLNRSDATD